MDAKSFCTPNGWCWDNPRPSGQELMGVWAAGPEDVWMVGALGLIQHWDGTTWTQVPSGFSESLFAVWGSGPRDVWATGAYGATLHWDGTVWRRVSNPLDQETISYDLFGLWGSGPGDVWAGGHAGTLLHWDGTGWTRVPGGITGEIFSIWGASARDVWAVGADASHGRVQHFDGKQWSPVSVPVTTARLYEVRGSSADHVVAAGTDSQVLVWNGSTWSALKTPSTSSEQHPFLSVWTSGPTDLWLSLNVALLHFDGTSWTTPPAVQTQTINRLGGLGPQDFWSVGARGEAAHFQDGAWTLQTRKGPLTADITGLRAFAPNDIWASCVSAPGMVHFDGHEWTPMPFARMTWFNAVWGRAPNDLWIAGEALIHWTGSSWKALSMPYDFSAILLDVWSGGPEDAWVITESQVGHLYDGTWTILTPTTASGSRARLTGLWGSSPNDVWVTAEDGLRHWDGTTLKGSPVTADPSRVQPPLEDVWGSSSNDVWVVGPDPESNVFHWDGTSWKDVSLKWYSILSVQGDGRGHVWLGAYGDVASWTGTGWSVQYTGISGSTRAMALVGQDLLTVGDHGVILRQRQP